MGYDVLIFFTGGWAMFRLLKKPIEPGGPRSLNRWFPRWWMG